MSFATTPSSNPTDAHALKYTAKMCVCSNKRATGLGGGLAVAAVNQSMQNQHRPPPGYGGGIYPPQGR